MLFGSSSEWRETTKEPSGEGEAARAAEVTQPSHAPEPSVLPSLAARTETGHPSLVSGHKRRERYRPKVRARTIKRRRQAG